MISISRDVSLVAWYLESKLTVFLTAPETSENSPFNNYTSHAGKAQLHASIKSTKDFTEQSEKDPRLLSSYFTPLKDAEFSVRRKPLYVDLQKSAEDAFFIEKVDENEKKDVFFVASALARLHHLKDMIKAQQMTLLTAEYLKKVLHTMEQLIFFVVKNEDGSYNLIPCNDTYFCAKNSPWAGRKLPVVDKKNKK